MTVILKIAEPTDAHRKRCRRANPTMLTCGEAAQILGCDRRSIRLLCISGKIPAQFNGHCWLIQKSDLHLINIKEYHPQPTKKPLGRPSKPSSFDGRGNVLQCAKEALKSRNEAIRKAAEEIIQRWS